MLLTYNNSDIDDEFDDEDDSNFNDEEEIK